MCWQASGEVFVKWGDSQGHCFPWGKGVGSGDGDEMRDGTFRQARGGVLRSQKPSLHLLPTLSWTFSKVTRMGQRTPQQLCRSFTAFQEAGVQPGHVGPEAGPRICMALLALTSGPGP